jgi:hypothetical protein
MVKTRSVVSMPYPVIKENSRRHFLNSLFSDGGSWLFGASGVSGGLLWPVALLLFMGVAWLEARDTKWLVGRTPWLNGARAQRHRQI